MSFDTVPLSEIAEVRLGRQRSPKNHSGPNNRKYLRAANVGWNGLILDDVKVMNFSDAEMATYRLQPGDLLLNEASGSPAEVGKPAIWMDEIEDCAFQNTLLRVRPGPAVEPRYLLHYLRQQAVSAAFARGSRGVGIHHLGREALANWPVALPSLAEQRRITAILDHADALRAKRGEALERLRDLTQSIFIEMFGDPHPDRTRWPTVALGEALTRIESGSSPNCLTRPARDGEYGILKLGAVTTGTFIPHENKALPSGVLPDLRNEVRVGDLLFTRKNTSELVGACAYVRDTPQGLLLPDLIFRLCLAADSRLIPQFVRHAMMYPSLRGHIQRLAGGSAGSMPNISKAKLQTVQIPRPPQELQRQFQDRLMSIDGLLVDNSDSSMRLDSLFTSLQSRAFRRDL
jgi:type I restriction enzyme S subunit